MPINDALQSGIQGFERASQGIEQAALDINRQTQTQQQQDELAEARQAEAAATNEAATQPVQDATRVEPQRVDEALVNLRVEEFNARANVNSIQTADEVLGTLIDTRA